MPTKWQKIRIDIPNWIRPEDRMKLADDIVEYIRQRTESGFDKNNRPFPKYSKEYIKSLDFRIAGKGRNVNLTLSGDMLAALDVISQQSDFILVGFENGSEENARADGNITGAYGQPFPIRGKKRDFLGINKKKVWELAEQYRE